MRSLKHLQNEQGATMILVALLIVILVGLAALAVDVGQLYVGKQRAQNVCDAAALSGARYLTGTADCTGADGEAAVAALDCVSTNNTEVNKWQLLSPGTDDPGATIEFPTTVTDLNGQSMAVSLGQAIRVSGDTHVNYAFAGVFGVLERNVPAASTAVLDIAGSLTSRKFVPLAASDSTIFGDGTAEHPPIDLDPDGPTILLHTGSWQGNFLGPGNFGSLDYAQSGGSGYEGLLAGDSTVPIDLALQNYVDTLTGDKIGPTLQGLEDRLAKETNPNYAVEDTKDLSNEGAWDYWVDNVDSVTGLHDDTWRIVIVPVIEDPPPGEVDNGKTEVRITGFAGFFIECVHTKKETIDGVDYEKGDIEGHFIQGIKMGEDIKWIFPTGDDTTPDSPQLILAIKLLS